VDDLDADRFRRVHRAPAAEGDEAVAAGFDVRGPGAADELDIGVCADLVEEDRVLEVRERRIGETGRDDSFVRDQKRPSDSQLRNELADARDRAGTMDDPGRHLDGSNCLDFNTHRLASLSHAATTDEAVVSATRSASAPTGPKRSVERFL